MNDQAVELKIGSTVAHRQTNKTYRVVGFGFADAHVCAGSKSAGGPIVVLGTDSGERRSVWRYLLDPYDERSEYEIRTTKGGDDEN